MGLGTSKEDSLQKLADGLAAEWSADPANVQSDYDEWCERWAAALDATRDLEWAEILAVISGSAVRALPPF